jgi:type I restriction enzyme S subunit
MTTDLDFQDTPIGLIPKDWDVVTLTNDNQAEVIMGQSPPGHSYNTEEIGIPFFQGNADFGDLYPIIKIYTTQPLKKSIKDDILVSVRAPVGEFNLSPCDCCIGRGLAAIRITSNDLDLKYLYYHLNHHSIRLSRVEEGTTFKAIKKADLIEFLIARPPISDQRNIAKILDTVDRTITQTEQLIAKLRAIKSGLLHDLLTRGIGEDGRVRDPEKQPEEFKETDSGRIPQKWKIVQLSDVAEIIMGQSPPGGTYNNRGDGVPLINGPAEYGDRYPRKLQWTTAPTKMCRIGDILFCVRGSTTGRINISNDSYCIGRGVAAVRGIKGVSYTAFLELYLNTLGDQILSEARGSGSTFPSITSPRLSRTEILLPDFEEQKRIIDALESVHLRITSEKKYSEKLQHLKRGLMQDLLTGRVRVTVPKEKCGES